MISPSINYTVLYFFVGIIVVQQSWQDYLCSREQMKRSAIENMYFFKEGDVEFDILAGAFNHSLHHNN